MTERTVDKNNPMPRYLQVRGILEEAIRAGKYLPGSRLPGERDLATYFNVSQMTVNKALHALVDDGWVRREVGSGTFVEEGLQIPAPTSIRIGFAVPFSASFAEEDFYLGSLLRGIQRALVNAPVSLAVLEAPDGALYDRVVESGVDGCILIDVLDHNLADVQRLLDDGMKMVIIGADQEPLNVAFVDSDNASGTKEAVDHLIAEGHTRVAGAFAYMGRCNSRVRHDAFVDAMREHGLSVPEHYLLDLGNGQPASAGLRDQVLELLDNNPRPTAIFCGGYYVALELCQVVREAGLSVPEDISVVGFDDPISARYLSPPLTTVRQPLEEMGQCAMTSLSRWLLDAQEPRTSNVLPAHLVVRGSTAPLAPTAKTTFTL